MKPYAKQGKLKTVKRADIFSKGAKKSNRNQSEEKDEGMKTQPLRELQLSNSQKNI